MATRVLISLPVSLGVMLILVALRVDQPTAVGIGTGWGAAASVLVDSRKEPRPAWGWAIVHGVGFALCATLLMSWLR